ncbi:DgyrCDS365 [Dimorphilus gyrociliatus]|uniref:IkappaB kinase n=1 Tax=Dimorphilus gyrociliatus TaxID=2664684 RepID=A0A7I8V4F8_9ANNE|nr:DgyrCDS365 [Dimorphilus gyrociliatus]
MAPGEWEFIEELGRGAFGAVFLFQESETKNALAVKVCVHSTVHPKMKERWEHEIRTLLELDHSNVVKAVELPDLIKERFATSAVQPLCMEYCEKGNLRTYLKKCTLGSKMKEEEVIHLTRDIGSAITYLHSKGIAHRDIKPDNIVLKGKNTTKNEPYLFKLIDLGFAKEVGMNEGVHSRVGTPKYLPPEISETKRKCKYSTRVDYWSYGCVIFEVITGSLPFLKSDIRAKSDKHICSRSDLNGCSVFEETIKSRYFPNYCYPWAIEHLENMLRLLLRAEESNRGGKAYVNDSYEWMEELDILSNYIRIYLLDICTMKEFSYGFPANAKMNDIIDKIQEDISAIVGSKFEIIDVTGCLITKERDFSFYTKDNKTYCNWFLSYEIRTKFRPNTPEIPEHLGKIIKSPSAYRPTEEIKLAWQQSIYFCNCLQLKCNRMCDGIVVYIKSLEMKRLKLIEGYKLLDDIALEFKGFRTLYEISYKADLKHLEKFVKVNERRRLEFLKAQEKWSDGFKYNFDIIDKCIKKLEIFRKEKNVKLNKMKEKINELAIRYTSIPKKTKYFYAEEVSKKFQELKVMDFTTNAKNLVDIFEKPKENFNALLKAFRNFAISKDKNDISKELSSNQKLLQNEYNHIQQVMELMRQEQENRQFNIWQLMESSDNPLPLMYPDLDDEERSLQHFEESLKRSEIELESLGKSLNYESLKPTTDWSFLNE